MRPGICLCMFLSLAACTVDHSGLAIPASGDAGDPTQDGALDVLTDAPMDGRRPDGPTLVRRCGAFGTAVLFVSTSGSDANMGTNPGSAVRTIGRARFELVGDVICIGRGFYREDVQVTRSVTMRGGYVNFDTPPTEKTNIEGLSSDGLLVEGLGRITVGARGFPLGRTGGAYLGR